MKAQLISLSPDHEAMTVLAHFTASPKISRVNSRSNSVVRASINGGEDGVGSAASAGGDSIAEGKAPSAATLGKSKPLVTSGDKFSDPRWIKGTWDLTKFTKDAKVDWDAVINAEVLRRKWLEENPEASSNSEPVLFETSTVPWWAWVKRFHLPEAELLNGRAAMIGYISAYLVDAATGVGLVDQSNSFFGKLLLFITVCGVLLIRKNSDIANLRNLANESTFYDKQWQATWKDSKDTEKSGEQ
ncbi:unnamed protein product [Sphagnum jensenii]|uniref:Uncharacterized protein n=1 Tax=Sphagnum jensenii TaxID=128206 RepID=A0ABP1BFM1_9BRYO